jgi:putative transposase
MTEKLEVLKPLSEIVRKAQLKNLSIIINAMLSMTGYKTMLNISRWTKEELSYRSIQRFFSDKISWIDLFFKLFLVNIFTGQKLVLAVDETIVTKSRKATYGIDLFFNSIYQKVMKSLCFSCISIIDVDKLKSYPLFVSQLVFTPEEKLEAKAKKEKIKQSKGNKRGRKKGSKNNVKEKDSFLYPQFTINNNSYITFKNIICF